MNYRHTPDGFLSFMMHKLTITLGLDATKLKLLIERYIKISKATNEHKKHHVRVNIFKEITSDRMTIKVFFKILAILRIKKVRFNLIVTTYLNKEIVVSEEFNLEEIEEEETQEATN